jgi:hypothetical protein
MSAGVVGGRAETATAVWSCATELSLAGEQQGRPHVESVGFVPSNCGSASCKRGGSTGAAVQTTNIVRFDPIGTY